MRVDVVLRYIGVVMLFIAMFMLLSAGISYLSGMDSAFYPLLLSSLLTALLGAFPLIFVGKREQITNKEGFCIVVGAWLVACVVSDVPLPDLGRGVLAGQRLVRERLGPHDHRIDDPERCRSPAPRIAVLAHVVDVDGRCGRGDVRAGGPAVDGAQQDDALQRGAFDDGQGQLPLPFADHRADPAGGLCGADRAVDRAAQDGGHELVRRPVPRHVGLRHERILDQERQHRLFRQSGDRHDPDRSRWPRRASISG